MAFLVPERYRLTAGRLASHAGYGNNGAFEVPLQINGVRIVARVIASDDRGWEHVSVSLANRTPSWEVMCAIKEMFWSDEDCVVQYHPPKSDYVNCHPHCLHLWKPTGVQLPRPDKELVGGVPPAELAALLKQMYGQ